MPSPHDDDTLDKLRSWHAGDRAALEALVHENLTWIADHIHRNLLNRVEAERAARLDGLR